VVLAAHRFRTTATHELGHVKFHSFLWLTESRPASLFPEAEPSVVPASPRCKRDSIQSLAQTDWMEWQAGYACGAFLMPVTYLKRVVDEVRAEKRWSQPPQVDSEEGRYLIGHVGQRGLMCRRTRPG